MSNNEKAFFSAARSVSMLSNHQKRMGCVIVDHHHIISSGHNSQTKCHRIQAQLDQRHFGVDDCLGPVHAEVDALIPLLKHKRDLSGATLYVYRETRNGTRSMARPCQRCMELIMQCGIKKIKYTTSDGFATEKIE